MVSIEGVIFIAIVLIAVFMHARTTSKLRAKIKERANRDCDEEKEPSLEELENRLGESELMYEGLEETYWLHVSILIGVASHIYWHIWYLSVLLTVVLGFIGTRYLSLRPFTTGVPDR